MFFISATTVDPKWAYILPSVETHWMQSQYDPVGDGNCGFRALGYALINKDEKYDYLTIKKQMLAHLDGRTDWYLSNDVYIDDDIKKMKDILNATGRVGSDLWFSSPDCCQLAADTYLTPICFHSFEGATLFIPMTNTRFATFKPIQLHLQASHISLLTFRPRIRLTHPPIYYIYNNVCDKAGILPKHSQFPPNKNPSN